MVTVAEASRRVASQVTHRVRSLPILALSVHSACNCRCVMCDIWKANAASREISLADLDRHVDSLERLHVRRVMLTGGEPLLHSNLWAFCERLREHNIQITLVTTGLLLAPHAAAIGRLIDEVVVSIDGPHDVHDAIRRVKGGFDRIVRGLAALKSQDLVPRTIARSVVQRANHSRLVETVESIRDAGVTQLSFLAADVSSSAFNRPQPWGPARVNEIALSAAQIVGLGKAIEEVRDRRRDDVSGGFIVGGLASLWRIHAYYSALAGQGSFPKVRCNAPWVSAVLEPDGQLRPCFFHAAYDVEGDGSLEQMINAPAAVRFRRALDVSTNATCQRCVCSLSLSLATEV